MANGIPALLGKVANVTNTVSLVVSDVLGILGLFAGPQWGVFNQDGTIALQPDSIISLDFKRELLVPNYPMEQGAFESYNKVATPSDTSVRMTKGGSSSDRAAFLVAVSTLVKSLTLVNIAMPEGTLIRNVNAVRFDLRRTSTNGVGLITVDMAFREIRVTATTAFSNTAQPSGADAASNGNVQPQTPTTAQSAAASVVQ